MPHSLPTDPPGSRSLTEVLPQLVRALEGGSDWFAPVRSAVLILVDGLGRSNLGARAGHARFLASRMAKKDTARTVFPSTTATALTSLLTGTPPGEHGVVGYRIRVPGTDRYPNQLKGWETDGLDPVSWQRAAPLLEREAGAGRPCFVVSPARYADTGFTRAIQRGAVFVAANTPAERLARAAELAAAHEGALIYVYVPELDAAGHRDGWQGERWLTGLERLDGELRRFEGALGEATGAVVTADHGMVDVPAYRHVLLPAGSELLAGVAEIAGEPRMLHVYADPGASADVLERWRASEQSRAWVLSRAEAVAAGLFGPRVDAEVLPRIGDVLVAARAEIAYYDDRLSDKKAQHMIGQHGSLTDQERIVPLIGLGALARTD